MPPLSDWRLVDPDTGEIPEELLPCGLLQYRWLVNHEFAAPPAWGVSGGKIEMEWALGIDGFVIQVQDGSFTEDLTIDWNKSVVLEGGCDGAFSTISGYTTLNGNINITDGVLTLENFILQ